MPIEEGIRTKKKGNKKWKFLLSILILLVLVGFFSNFFMQIKHIKSGYIGIKASIGNPIDNSVDYDLKVIKGYTVFIPLYTEISIYPTTIQTVAYDAINVNALDGTEFVVKPNISYQLDESEIKLLYMASKQSLEEMNNTYIKELVTYSYAKASGNFSSDSLVSHKNTFDSLVNTILASKLGEIGLILKNTNSNLQIPLKIKDIIALRSHTLQNAILAEDKIKQTEAETQVQLLVAKANSKEDSLRNSAITSLAIQKMFVEKWDGKLPIYGDTPKIYKNITE